MKFALIAVWLLFLLLFSGCFQAAPKATENAVYEAQIPDVTTAPQTMLEQARAFRKANPELFGDAGGVLIIGLVPGGQGEKIGLQVGDILLTYDGIPLETKEHLIELTSKKETQTPVTLTYLRERKLHDAVMQGGRIGIQIGSLIFSQSEAVDQLIEKGNNAYYQSYAQDALQLFQKALDMSQAISYRWGEGASLNNLGNVYSYLGQYPQALEYLKASLAIKREIGDRKGEADNLDNLGLVHINLAQYLQAIEHHQASLAIFQEIDDIKGEADSFNNLGNVYRSLGQYIQAIKYHEKALTIFRAIGNQLGEGQSSSSLGNVYSLLNLYPEAIKHFDKSLEIAHIIGNQTGKSANLNNLGSVYHSLSQYTQAIEHLEASLAISLKIGDRLSEAKSRNNLGSVHNSLNQYPQAIEHHNKALIIYREIGDPQGEASSLNNLGIVYENLNQYLQALKEYEDSLVIYQEIGDPLGKAYSLGNLAIVYSNLNEYPQALEHFEKSLTILNKIGNRKGASSSLLGIGIVHDLLGNYPQSLKHTQQALAIKIQINAPGGLWQSWSSLSNTLRKLDRIDATILAGKQAVNTLQSMRKSNTKLEKKLQNSFLKDKTRVYHDLVALLIEQDRLAEAEQIMAMLKEEEYFDYIQRDGRGEVLEIRASYTSAEQAVVAELDQLGKQLAILGEKYENLAKLSKIDEQAKAGLSAVKAELERVEADFYELLSILQERLTQARSKVATTEFDSPRLKELQQKVLAKHEAVMVSTVITTDKLYLLLTTPYKQLVRHSDINAEKLDQLISGLHNSLRHPKSNLAELKDLAQRLYAHLVKPLENDLQQIKARNLMWALDGTLRYVPMAALFDGKQFLIEKYGLSLYTPAAHSTWGEPDTASWRAVGLGVSQAFPGFGALPAVPHELRSIIRQDINDQSGALPGEIYLDRAFDRDTLESVVQKPENRVLHIASHFKLQPGDSNASKLLLGDGDTLSLNEFREQPAFELRNVDLLTLSACDTAIGERGTGGEIESFAVMAQRKGANGVLASLWRVEDESTALLMKQLYRLRSKTKSMNMAEALRQAQIPLLNGEIHSDEHDYSHPFFWSPFVMMGNWL